MPTDPKSILFIITRGDSIGGGQIHVRDLSIAAISRGLRVGVAVGSAGPLTEALEKAGVSVFLLDKLVREISPKKDIAAVKELREVIRAFKPDLVSCHTAKAGMVGRMAASGEKVPSVFTAHGWQFADGIGFSQKMAVLAVEYFCARLCGRIITVSEYDYRLARRYHVAGSNKLRLVHNGMPDRPAPIRVIRGSKSAIKLIMTARFQEQKDHETLFRALAELKDLDWSIDLVGDGPLFEQFKEMARELGIEDRVAFLGQRLDVPDLLDTADIFVLSTRWEGFPRSILEAMRASLPVVTSDVGGCKESVSEGETGYLVSAGDIAALRDRLRALMINEEARLRLGNAGRARFDRFFTFDAMYEATQAVWRECLN
ncbi:MAG: glycosyltransferase family 4 protein [Treponemataceae bacterium]